MDQHNGFDHEAESVGPEVDDSVNPTDASPSQDKPRSPAGREMLIQLQQMIDTVSYQAAPVIREVAAKAAELAAVAGQKAGPLAYKAAEVTEQFGQKVAARSSTIAGDLRRATATEQAARDEAAATDQPAGAPEDSDASTDSDAGPEDAPPTL